MERNFPPGIKAVPAGFVVHAEKCWLGASLHVRVTDPFVSDPQGIAEFKYPYPKAFVHPHKACKDVDFFCSMTNHYHSVYCYNVCSHAWYACMTQLQYHHMHCIHLHHGHPYTNKTLKGNILSEHMLTITKCSYSYKYHLTMLSGVIFAFIQHVVLPLKGFTLIIHGKVHTVLNSTVITWKVFLSELLIGENKPSYHTTYGLFIDMFNIIMYMHDIGTG